MDFICDTSLGRLRIMQKRTVPAAAVASNLDTEIPRLMQRIQVEDLLLIAEDLLGIPAEEIARTSDLGLADSALNAPFAGFGGHDFYEGFAVRAAILASRIVRNHPLLDGNKRLALLAMIEFLRRNDQDWPSDLDQDEVAETFERLAARELSEQDFARWVAGKLRRS
jgi:death-on-curing protein